MKSEISAGYNGMGSLYVNGHCVDKNLTKAVEFFQKSVKINFYFKFI